MKTAAVLPSRGIGDALMMMVAAHRLHMQGYAVTTFHPLLPQLSAWFPGHHIISDLREDWHASFDLIIVQNDGTAPYNGIPREKLSIFYPTYDESKYLSLSPLDRIFDENAPMVDNIATAIATLFKLKQVSKNNGIKPVPGLKHRKHLKRVVIHPTSSAEDRTWLPERFFRLAKTLKSKGFEPVFAVSPKEREGFAWAEDEGLSVPLFPSLAELAEFVFESGYVIGNESGTGHLGSNLQIPTLIVAGHERRMRLWRPGWLAGGVITPPKWVPNVKKFRIREEKWQHFITPSTVLRRFKKLIARDALTL